MTKLWGDEAGRATQLDRILVLGATEAGRRRALAGLSAPRRLDLAAAIAGPLNRQDRRAQGLVTYLATMRLTPRSLGPGAVATAHRSGAMALATMRPCSRCTTRPTWPRWTRSS